MHLQVIFLIAFIGTGAAIIDKCRDLRVIENPEAGVSPSILYFEISPPFAMVTCVGRSRGVFEMIANDKSLGIAKEKPHKIICFNGHWYSKSKYGNFVRVQDIACIEVE